MTVARSLLVPKDVSRCYHCISRCVRGAHLCGGRYNHRRQWIQEHLVELDKVFAIGIAAYAIMDNHFHLVVWTRPQQAAQWSDEEVARRWLELCPSQAKEIRQLIGTDDPDKVVAHFVTDQKRVATCRARLADLGWFMRCLKQPIARRANIEDDVTGHFWEGRYKSYALLDLAAILTCLVYIDLNVIRAQVARTPEQSDFTSVQDRIHVRQRYLKLRGMRQRSPKRAEGLVQSIISTGRLPTHAEDGIWLVPIQHREDTEDGLRDGLFDMTLDDYLQIVDKVGRHLRPGKLGAIPTDLPPILDRLLINADRWIQRMSDTLFQRGTVIGNASSRAAEATRRNASWVVSACRIYEEPTTG